MNQNIHATCKGALDSLATWRDRYHPCEYPVKVVHNLFYTLMPVAEIWRDIENGFINPVNMESPESYRENKARLVAKHRRAQVNVVRPNLLNVLARGCTIGSCSSSHFMGLVRRASQGANAQVEEIEFSYMYYDAISDLIMDWGAFGMMGLSYEDAYLNVANMAVGGVNYRELGSVVDALGHPVAFVMNSEGGYRPMQPLW